MPTMKPGHAQEPSPAVISTRHFHATILHAFQIDRSFSSLVLNPTPLGATISLLKMAGVRLHNLACLAVLLLSLLQITGGIRDSLKDRDLIGWSENAARKAAPDLSRKGQVILSWNPRIFLYRNFLSGGERPTPTAPPTLPFTFFTPVQNIHTLQHVHQNMCPLLTTPTSSEECDHLRAKAEPRLTRSGVVEEHGGDKISEIRTSWGMFFSRGEDEVLRDVEKRLSEWSMIPVENGEGIQVLRYEPGQEYKPHFD
jgi:prolyl 4-hydroxylase